MPASEIPIVAPRGGFKHTPLHNAFGRGGSQAEVLTGGPSWTPLIRFPDTKTYSRGTGWILFAALHAGENLDGRDGPSSLPYIARADSNRCFKIPEMERLGTYADRWPHRP